MCCYCVCGLITNANIAELEAGSAAPGARHHQNPTSSTGLLTPSANAMLSPVTPTSGTGLLTPSALAMLSPASPLAQYHSPPNRANIGRQAAGALSNTRRGASELANRPSASPNYYAWGGIDGSRISHNSPLAR